jgi:hypothetical protein
MILDLSRTKKFPYPDHIRIFSHPSDIWRYWQDNRYSSCTFPTSLTNPRKSVTYTLARRDWDDYLNIDFRKNFHPKRTLESDTN